MFGHVVGVGAGKRVGLPVWLLRTDCPRLTINIPSTSGWMNQFLWYITYITIKQVGAINPWDWPRAGKAGCLSHEPMASHGHLPHGHEPADTHEIRGSLEPDNISSHQNLGTLYLAVRHSKLSKMVTIDICCELRLEFSCQWGKYQNITHPKTSRLIGSRRSAFRGSAARRVSRDVKLKGKASQVLRPTESFMIPRILHFHGWFMVDWWLIYSCSGGTFHSGHATTCPYDLIWLNELSPTKWLVHCSHIIPYLSITTFNES